MPALFGAELLGSNIQQRLVAVRLLGTLLWDLVNQPDSSCKLEIQVRAFCCVFTVLEFACFESYKVFFTV